MAPAAPRRIEAAQAAATVAAAVLRTPQPRLPPMFRTRLTSMLGIDHPIMSAGMGGVALSALTVAVTNAGGFGCMGATTMFDLVQYKAELEIIRKNARGPWGVDILAGTNDLEEMVSMLIAAGASVFVSGRGTSPEVIEQCHAAGLKVGCVAGQVKHAVKAVEQGYDFVIIQGTEAGGHTGDVALFPLLPQVLDAVGHLVPVVAAGGIFDGRGLAAALAMGALLLRLPYADEPGKGGPSMGWRARILGADGVWVGTRFLVSEEAVTVPGWKEKMLETSSRDTLITAAYTGKPCRVIRNQYTDSLPERMKERGVSESEYFYNIDSDELLAVNHIMRPKAPGVDLNVVGAIRAVEPAHKILNDMLIGAKAQLARFNRALL